MTSLRVMGGDLLPAHGQHEPGSAPEGTVARRPEGQHRRQLLSVGDARKVEKSCSGLTERSTVPVRDLNLERASRVKHAVKAADLVRDLATITLDSRVRSRRIFVRRPLQPFLR